MGRLFKPKAFGLTDQQFLQGAADMPLGAGKTFLFGALNTFEESFGGTAIRELKTPDLAFSQKRYEVGGTYGGGRGGSGRFAITRSTPDTAEEVAARGDELYQTEDQYKASPFYREGVPFEKGLTRSRAQALSEMHDDKRIREYYAGKRPITAFIGGIAGGVAAPENYIPILGEASAAWTTARVGKVAGRALIGSADAAINTGLTQLATAPLRSQFGDDTSWDAIGQNMGFAALAGGAIGGLGGIFESRYSGRKVANEAVSKVRDAAQSQAEPLPQMREQRQPESGAYPFTPDQVSITKDGPGYTYTPGLKAKQDEVIYSPDPDTLAQFLNLTKTDVPAERPKAVQTSSQFTDYADFRPEDLAVDAKRFQYKSGGDGEGVIDTLKGVTKWDRNKAGTIIVWQDKKGKNWVVDGHQRYGLAKRLREQGQDPVLHALIWREKDGITAEQAKVEAANINISQGSGTPIDAAKILRVHPEFMANLPKNAVTEQGRGLAALSDDAFGMVVNELVPPDQAALVGKMAPDKKTHLQIMDVLAKNEPASQAQAASMISDVLDAPQVEETMVDMFGSSNVTQILFKERAIIKTAAAAALRKNRAAFNVLVKEEARIKGASNKLATAKNIAIAQSDAEMMAMLNATANRKGPIADALAVAAKELHDGASRRKVVQDFIDTIRGEKPAPESAKITQDWREMEVTATDLSGEPVKVNAGDAVDFMVTRISSLNQLLDCVNAH